MTIKPLGLLLQIIFFIKNIFGILRQRLKAAGSAVAYPPVLQVTEMKVWSPQPHILLNNFFRSMEVRIQMILLKCRFCIYYWPKDTTKFFK